MDIETLLTFILASILLSLTPGPDNIFVLVQSAVHGARAGLLVTLGLCTGLVVHTALVAGGVAALFLVNDLAFTVLKLAGASYLLYLAYGAWRAGGSALAEQQLPPQSAAQLFRRGIFMNLTNPKVAIFFLAFLPQFANPDDGNIVRQIMLLGFVFILVASLVFSAVALLSGRLAALFKRSGTVQARLNRVAALVFAGLALRLAASTR
ncbi:MAG: LysE family translocator [Pseudohongiellaceae bacterium]